MSKLRRGDMVKLVRYEFLFKRVLLIRTAIAGAFLVNADTPYCPKEGPNGYDYYENEYTLVPVISPNLFFFRYNNHPASPGSGYPVTYEFWSFNGRIE